MFEIPDSKFQIPYSKFQKYEIWNMEYKNWQSCKPGSVTPNARGLKKFSVIYLAASLLKRSCSLPLPVSVPLPDDRENSAKRAALPSVSIS